MVRLDHIRIAVRDWRASRDWYVHHFGFSVEFETARRGVVGLHDDADLTLILERGPTEVPPRGSVLYLDVGDVEAAYRRLREAGVRFVHPPRKRFWGCGAELEDPDGHRIRLWDETTMEEKG